MRSGEVTSIVTLTRHVVSNLLLYLVIGFCSLPLVTFADTESKPTLSDLASYLAEIDTLYSEILQVNSDGSKSEGRLLLDRPLRARVDYFPPNKGIIIARSGTVAVFDTGSNTGPSHYPLKHTPFYHLLVKDLDLTDSDTVLNHLIGRDYNELHLKVKSEQVGGHLELVFQNDPLILVGWVFVDDLGNRTMVKLHNTRTNLKIDPKFFNIEHQKKVLGQP